MSEESGNTSNNVSTRLKKYLKEVPFFCKVAQLVMCVIAIGLIIEPFNNRMKSEYDMNHAGLVYIALGGYILINGIFVICYLYGEKAGQKTSLMFARFGTVLCFAAGVVLIYDWKNVNNNYISRYLDRHLEQMLASGIFAIFASIFSAVEMYFIMKEK